MRIDKRLTDDAILRELGQRLAAARLARNLTQAALAKEAGISKRTLERLESGEVAVQLASFVRACRALGLTDGLETLVPEPVPSPVEELIRHGSTRRRASGARGVRAANEAASVENKTWTWNESK